MATRTGIEWTEVTWNPTTGCDRMSAGCDNCYALALARRLKAMGSAKYQHDGDPRTSGPGFGLTVHPDALRQPYTWGAPRVVFVNSMSDLFHEDVPDDYVVAVCRVMERANWHTYQVLTKRSQRLRDMLRTSLGFVARRSHIWWGVSVENRRHGLPRVEDLRAAPAGLRML